jgi:hypothetical protein
MSIDAIQHLRANSPFRSLWSTLGLVPLLLHDTDSNGQALAVALLLLVGNLAPEAQTPIRPARPRNET